MLKFFSWEVLSDTSTLNPAGLSELLAHPAAVQCHVFTELWEVSSQNTNAHSLFSKRNHLCSGGANEWGFGKLSYFWRCDGTSRRGRSELVQNATTCLKENDNEHCLSQTLTAQPRCHERCCYCNWCSHCTLMKRGERGKGLSFSTHPI